MSYVPWARVGARTRNETADLISCLFLTSLATMPLDRISLVRKSFAVLFPEALTRCDLHGSQGGDKGMSDWPLAYHRREW